ncbi:MAG: repeat protein [Gemmataceae bacterium]|nr:repeat protein [Gemmataceae bacterium]
MDAADAPGSVRPAIKGLLFFAAVVGGPVVLCLGPAAFATHPTPAGVATPAPASVPLLPNGDGVRDPRHPDWSTDPSDPFPMPPELAGVKLMEQTAAEARAKSAGCVACHQTVGDPHGKPTLRIGCTDCHGGNPGSTTKDQAHVHPRNPHLWPTAANPVRSYTLLNHESPEFVRFVNPGDFRIAHISCGTAGCHPKEVQTNRKQIMTTGCMLWGAALYNNGSIPNKRSRFGEAYGTAGAPLRLKTFPPPTEEEMKRGVVPFLDPLPRFEMSQPGNVLRIFEPGGRFQPEIGIPERLEEPGRPRTRLSARGLGTANRTDPVWVSLNKTRLFDPTLNFLGTNDNPGDFRSSGCTACHVVYANDRSPIHSGPYAGFGNRGTTASKDPTIPKDEPGHPIDHRFTTSIPTSQCMVCHVHPGTSVMNSYLGYMWYDEETEARLMYPAKQKNPTAEELIRSMLRNPNESAARGNLSDPAFVADMVQLNPHMAKQQVGDFHSHGWAFRAVFKKDRRGSLLDHAGQVVGPPSAEKLTAATSWPNAAREFHQKNRFDDPRAARQAETKLDACRGGTPVHLMDIHMEKGMHCVDCHFSQDVHGNNRLHMEVRAATEIQCTDCHGTASAYTTLKTSGPASYTSAPDGKGRNLLALKTPFGAPRFEVRDAGGGRVRVFQNSMVEKGLRWEIVQTRDTVADPTHPRYNAKSALAKTVRVENGKMVWGGLPAGGEGCTAHRNENMSCIACHSAWNPSCFGCHLPQRANLKTPVLHADGDVSRNYTAYNFQTLRDDVFMLARDGDVTGNRVNPARSSCAIHVGSYNGNRESIYVQQQTISAEGFGGTAFSTNVPHTVRGRGARETKQCTDCHLSKANDNNAWMGQLLMQGTGFTNFVGKHCWVAAEDEGLFGVVVTETTEPQAVFGSDLHRFAYPDDYRKHAERGGLLKNAHEHPGRDVSTGVMKPFKKAEVLMVQNRGEFLYAACGADGVRVFDIAFIDHKGFAERITTAPVSPVGQKFYLPSRYATYVAAPATVAVDPTRTHLPENKEGPIHPLFGYLYVCDKYEGLILTGAASTLDGNPVNNFLKRDLTFNPDGLLYGARHVAIVGHYAYVSCEAGLVVIDIDRPTEPKVTAVVGDKFLKGPRAVAVQFRYAYVCDEEGVKVLDVTDLARPVPKALIRLPEAHGIYLARTYAYVAAGPRGLVILDTTRPDEPRVDQVFTAGGCLTDVRDVKIGITYNSLFAYLADGKNGLRVVQLTSPVTPGYDGFSPRPTPRLVATYRAPHEGKILSVARGLDRDRAVDETGNQIGVFGRVGARPLNGPEQRKMYLRGGAPWYVSDDPLDAALYERRPGR